MRAGEKGKRSLPRKKGKNPAGKRKIMPYLHGGSISTESYLRAVRIRGEMTDEMDIVTVHQLNTATAANFQVLTPAFIQGIFAGTQFARLWNTTGTAVFNRYRITAFALTMGPLITTPTQAVGGNTMTGAYGIGPAGGSASTPASMSDVLAAPQSLLYLQPAQGTIATSAQSHPWCSKKDFTIRYIPNGTDVPWIDTTTIPTMGIANTYAYGSSTATGISNCYLTCRFQFVGTAVS